MQHLPESFSVGKRLYGMCRMKNARNHCYIVGNLLWLLVLLTFLPSFANAGSIIVGKAEPTFAVLQTKTAVYTNVTVAQQNKEFIFIMHATGVCNVKLSDLSSDTLLALGYKPSAEQEAEAKKATASPVFAQLSRVKLNDVEKIAKDWRANPKQKFKELTAGNPMALYIILGIFGVVHIFISTCFWLICRKTHIAPGPLVWVPVFQLIPLLRAANMPLGWFFAYFIPVLNIIAQIVWSVKIVKSRGKSPFVAFLLLLPITNFFAFLYLALSSSAPVKMESKDILALDFA